MNKSRYLRLIVIGLIAVILCCGALTGCSDLDSRTFEIEFYDGEEIYKTIEFDSSADRITFPTTPVKIGFDFEGWCFDELTTEDALVEGSIINDSIDHVEVVESNISDDSPAETNIIIRVYASWKVAINHVSFDANGGDGEMTSQEMTYGFETALSQNTLSKAGYVFKGWATSELLANAGTVAFLDGAKYTSLSSVRLYAVWVDNFDLYYKVNYNYNANADEVHYYLDSIQHDVSDFDYILKEDFDVWLMPPSRDYYSFLGWSLENNGDEYITQYTIEMAKENIPIYANWHKHQIVVYDANGGMFDNDSNERHHYIDEHGQIDSYNYYMKEKMGVISHPKDLAKYGCILSGWSSSAHGEAEFIHHNDIYKYETLYAIWEEGINITYKANGGEVLTDKYFDDGRRVEHYNYINVDSSALLVQYSTSMNSISKLDDIFAKEGHALVGWSRIPTATTADFDVIPDNESDIVIHAVWTSNSATVNFDATGGQMHSSISQYFKYHGPLRLVSDTLATGNYVINSQIPYRYLPFVSDPEAASPNGGKMFLGWSATKDGEVFGLADMVTITENITFYAVFVEKTIVKFDANGGIIDLPKDYAYSFNVESWTKDYMQCYYAENIELLSADYPVSKYFSKQGYIMVGWSAERNGPPITVYDIHKAVEGKTFYAIWQEAVTVTLDANGGSYNGGDFYTDYGDTSVDMLVAKGLQTRVGEMVIYPSLSDLTGTFLLKGDKKGYKFLGWSYVKDGQLITEMNLSFSQNTILYAVWEIDEL